MDALELLKEDHETVKELFEEIEATEDQKEKTTIFREIQSELETHARIEEEIFYPAMQKREELKDIEPKLKVLMENVEHHAEEEEEGKMFPKVRQLFSREDLESLGQELEAASQRKAS
jgi:hemerythrin superfamily protein